MISPKEISFPRYLDPNGVLCVFESGIQLPFEIRRVFTVSALLGDLRGDHAHKECTQLLVCVSGQIRVTCDDGLLVTNHLLQSMCDGLLIPPGIWAREEYLTDGAVLMVLCDSKYDEAEYIRDYDNFKKFVAQRERR